MKILKFKVQMKVILMITTTIISVFLIRLLLMGGLAKLLSFDSQRTEVYKDTDITHYQWYIGKNAKKEYADNWGMDESIFRESITDNMNGLDYKMVYYNPWDAQYLSYLVVEYDDKSYEEEIQRLEQYDSKEYKGYFGARGFRDKYQLLAIEVDPDHGLIYALEEENNQIIYVELIFCNYYYDIDYQDEIDIQYLPIGFDATPGEYEKDHELLRAEQVIRPTGLLDPEVEVRPVEGQIDDLIGEVNKEISKKNKVLVTTLTKRMAEDLTDYMREVGIRVKYLHSDIDTLERTEIIRDMRLDVFDVLVGINLLREGLDIPEITLVAILDSDKE